MLSVAKDQILNKARELFGSDLEITNYDVNIANDIFYKDGYYYEVKDVPMTGASIYYGWESDYFGNGFETCGYTLYDKYKANDDEIVIYTYYINAYEQVVSGRKYASQTSNKNQESIVDISDNELEELRDKEWTNELKEKAGYYKHTFNKDSNGNYYWNGTELIKI